MKPVRGRKSLPPPCTEACPAGIDVPRYIRHVQHGDFDGALAAIREKIPFPAVCGYACVNPCEARCARIQFDEPVAIRLLKRAAWEWSTHKEAALLVATLTGKTTAIVGSGPCGLTAGYYLALLGHSVEVFDREELAGGMLRYTIPGYRLPQKAIDDDLRSIWGKRIRFRGGRSVRVTDLIGRYDAILIASGAALSKTVAIPGSDLSGVSWGLDFLRSAKAEKKVPARGKVCVIGGGNVAIDAALTACRLGADDIRIICLEERNRMPAHTWEIDQAVEEGVVIENTWGPKVIHGKGGKVTGITCVRCISTLDRQGKFHPQYDPSVQRYFEADAVIFAIGQAPDATFIDIKGVETKEDGIVDVDDALMTGVKGIFAAGETVTGPSSIIDAIAQGRKAAVSIDKFLGGQGTIDNQGEEEILLPVCNPSPKGTARHRSGTTGLLERLSGFDPIEKGYSREKAMEEALRCLACDVREFTVEVDPLLCKECGYCREVCSLNVFTSSEVFNPSGYRPLTAKDTQRCVGCLRCVYICPDFAVSIQNGGTRVPTLHDCDPSPCRPLSSR